MPYANLSVGIDAAKRQELIDDVNELEAKMDFLVQLTTSEKKNSLRLGKGAIVFLQRALELCKQNPNFLPQYFQLAEFEKDVQDYEAMGAILIQINKIRQAVSDTATAFEQEGMRAALDFYKHAKAASAQDVPGAKTVADELAQMMPKHGKKKKS